MADDNQGGAEVKRKTAPLVRLASFIAIHGMTHTYRTIFSMRTWALVLIRRDNGLKAEDWTREPGA